MELCKYKMPPPSTWDLEEAIRNSVLIHLQGSVTDLNTLIGNLRGIVRIALLWQRTTPVPLIDVHVDINFAARQVNISIKLT